MSREKERVRERCGALASQVQQTCCGAAKPCCAPEVSAAEKIGYSPGEISSVPEGADLSLGCGNPLALAAISSGDTVLDLGSGAGFDALLAAARVGPTGRVIGVDMTPEMVGQARANAEKEEYENVDFRLGDIEELPVDDGSVDLVISNCVLNLVPGKPKAFREIVRVLKPGGRAAISDIVLDGPLPESLRGSEDAYCSCISGALGRQEYLAEMEAAGLQEAAVVAEADAAPLLAGECCGTGIEQAELSGVLTSVSVTAQKPPSGDV